MSCHIKVSSRFVTLIMTVFGLCAATFSQTITTVSQVRALSDDDYAHDIPFCITGLVTRSTAKSFFLDTANGSLYFWISNTVVQTGCIVRADGHTSLDWFANDAVLQATNVAVLGHAALPEPKLLTIDELLSGDYDHTPIRLRGFITDAFHDDIDSNYVIALLNVGGRILHISAANANGALDLLRSLIDADIEITCVSSSRSGGKRHFGGPIISLGSAARNIKILSPPPKDPFVAPPLKAFDRMLAENISGLKRHSVHGRVLAAWGRRNLLVRYGNGSVAKIALANGERLPDAGTWIDAVGFPETDLFTVNLANAHIRLAAGEPAPDETPETVSAYRIFHEPDTKRYDLDFHGRLVRIAGIVRTISKSRNEPGRQTVESDGILVPVDAGTSADALAKVEIGCQIEVTGVCIVESENWNPHRVVPTIKGFFLALRSPKDICILSYPPWWTPRRLAFVLSSLLLLLATILVWNVSLRRLVERRSRQLTKAQIEKRDANLRTEERTRIAAELHDYLAQNLTAMSYQLTAAKLTRHDDSATSAKHLETATAMLNSSRTELRRCLWDLKSAALEEPTFNQAIRRTLQQILNDTSLSVSFDIARHSVNDTTAHALLSVIRELAANAIRHGQAKSIKVVGEHDGERLKVTVTDDGIGFDPASCLRADDGHFGLDGIRNRMSRIGGEFTITSSPGHGTTAVIYLASRNATAHKSGEP